MFEEVVDAEGELDYEIEEIVSWIESLSLTPTLKPPLVVSEQENNIEQILKGKRRGFNMDFRVRRGRVGQWGGRSIANSKVMEVMH